MFGFLQQKKEAPQDVKGIRDSILHFVKQQLQKAEGGEGSNMRSMFLYLSCTEAEKHLYEAAVYADEPGRFKAEEVQRIADDYSINLPENWVLETFFTDNVPAEAVKAEEVAASLVISSGKKPVQQQATTAYIKVLHGEAEKEVYTLSSEGGKINIGREKKVQASDGFYRVNTIAFPADSSHESNKFVSRQHAHIEWDAENGSFLLYADEGGIPPRNKIKVRAVGGVPVKLQSTHIGHPLQEGDQIILGDSALLEFSFRND